MKKIATKKKKETLAARAENIKESYSWEMRRWRLSSILTKNIRISSHTVPLSFQKNKERDLAIIALLLASGVRLSEAVNLDLKDLNLNMMVLKSLVKVENETLLTLLLLLNHISKNT